MKTLVFCAGSPDADGSILEQISADLWVGVDAGAANLVRHGYTPDWAIGDFDSAPPPSESRQILRLLPEKDDTDLEYALQFILKDYLPENIEKIVILGALGGGRLDHLLCNIWLAHQARFAPWLDKIQFMERGNSVRFLRSGSQNLAREPDKKYVSFIGLTPIVALTLDGFKYPLHRQNYAYPAALISNEFSGSRAFVSFEEGIICVMQTRDVLP